MSNNTQTTPVIPGKILQQQIRNFCIIAHIDHGKTTLTDRLLHTTGVVSTRDLEVRMLDSNPIEKERGITIKLAPVRMPYVAQNGQLYILNLIDTPGHVDFGYEVSRSLAACEGALLVVDATQGIQAQTLSNFEKARELGLTVIPVLNKIDLPLSMVEETAIELSELTGVPANEILRVSAKTGMGVPELLEEIVRMIPPPTGDDDPNAKLRALVFASKYDTHRGVIAYVRVVDGVLTRQQIKLWQANQSFLPSEIGVFSPDMRPIEQLSAGEVGFISTALKEVRTVRVGDTVTTSDMKELAPLPGYKDPQPMVYFEFYPLDADDYHLLVEAAEKLALHDAALKFQPTNSNALGNGLRMGFLGILHATIVQERLEQEFQIEMIATAPSVPYQVELKSGEILEINRPNDLPDPFKVRHYMEPMTLSVIYTPRDHMGAVMRLCDAARGQLQEMQELGTLRMKLSYLLPLSEIIVSFHDNLKSISSGFASMEYELLGFERADLVKVSILVHHEEVEALAQIVVRDRAEMVGRRLVKRLKEVIPRQQFEVAIQAAVGGRILARESVAAFRKDVTAKLYGGDQTRKDKLLKKQKKGKARMKAMGRVQLPQEAFLAVLEQ